MNFTITKSVRWVVLALLLPLSAYADDLLWTWDNTNLRSDGTTITGARLHHIRYSLDGVEQPEILVDGSKDQHALANIVAGTYAVQVATSEDGYRGEWSEEVVKTFTLVQVAPPAKKTFTMVLTCDDCSLEVQ